MASLEEIKLDDGGLKIRLRNRAAKAGIRTAADRSNRKREHARIITMAWGDRYVEDLLAIAIPALLAPGNIPAFVAHFDAEFVIVTETRHFDHISRAPVISRLLQYCDLRLLPIDDLLSHWYGITLTYALVRGFADLGPAMVDTHLVFLNADFIVADGSYRKLAEMIRRGERLVVSPSYCMVLEDTVDWLHGHYDPVTYSLSAPRRAMAKEIIMHRHNTIRAKTVNQQLFRIHRYDQFYWYVNDETLLSRQMPIAVVYMRPERVLTEMPTFWDYGVISEYCPTTKPCVLGDSDDFLMAELRTEGTFRNLLHLGWPTVKEIAADLSSFTTKDHRDYGRHTLVLHSSDLPPNIQAEEKSLSAFVDSIYRLLEPPISYRNHPFWAVSFPSFLEMYERRILERHRKEKILTEVLKGPEDALRQNHVKKLESRRHDLEADMQSITERAQKLRHPIEKKLAELDVSYRHSLEIMNRKLERSREEQERRERPLKKALAKLDSKLIQWQENIRGKINSSFQKLPLIEDDPKSPRKKALPAPLLERLSYFYGVIFGRLTDTTPWHPYHLPLRHVVAAIAAAEARKPKEVLVIAVEGPLTPLLLKSIHTHKLELTPRMAYQGYLQKSGKIVRKYDFCFCDLDFDDLLEFRPVLEKIRPMMNVGGKIVLFHINLGNRKLDQSIFHFTKSLFPLFGRSRVSFTGSAFSAIAMRYFTKTIVKYDTAHLSGLISLAFSLLYCGPLARIVSWFESRHPPQVLPKHCTSTTIEIDLT